MDQTGSSESKIGPDGVVPHVTNPEPAEAQILADEKAQKKKAAPTALTNVVSNTSSMSPPISPTQSPPMSPPLSPPPSGQPRRPSSIADYYSSRPKFDRLGNPIPERKQRAMSSVYGKSKAPLPGDLGPNDPRKPRSPAPAKLPGDLGPSDPRKPRSAASSPARPEHSRHASDGSMTGQRLQEDPPRPGDETSGDEADADNDNDDTDLDESKRGRGRRRPEPGRTSAGKSMNIRPGSPDSDVDFVKPDPTKGESMLGFTRDVKIRVHPPSVRKRVLPSTAFDVAPSGPSTPTASDDETHSELRAAQQLSLTVSAIHSTPSAHRVIRQIVRGDYAFFQKEAEEGRKRQRMYLVATDLSPEAQYALEWTIGTVLRDGDTLFAVYAVDEEEGVGAEGGVEIGQGARSVMDTAAIVKALPNISPVGPRSPGPSPLSRTGHASADGRSVSTGPRNSADAERRRAIDDISQRCMNLLRKTRLQVRVVVEVFHCKSPRHMITEVIDFLSPTLVIIGSRGRSAVKGVLLGSFSNYLVTKSSVPVMVARKKLKKHSKTARNKDGTIVPYSGSGRTGRFSNVIQAPRVKGLRVPGWDKVGID